MHDSGSRELTALRVAWDAWRSTRSGPAAVAARQAARLEALVRVHAPGFPVLRRALPGGATGTDRSRSVLPVAPRLPNRS